MRKLIGMLPWMVLTTAAYGQIRSADVLYTHFTDVPTHGIRVGDECFVPFDATARWGWQVTLDSDLAKIKAEGLEFTVSTRDLGGQPAIPLRAAVTKAGGFTGWVMNSDTLEVYSELNSVSVTNGKIRIFAPLAFKPRTFYLTNPSRFIVDMEGVRLGAKTIQDLDQSARINQFRPDVVRLVVETANLPDKPAADRAATHLFELSLSDPAPPPPSQTASPFDRGDGPKPTLGRTNPPVQTGDQIQAADQGVKPPNSGDEAGAQTSPPATATTATRDIQINLDHESDTTTYLSVPLAQLSAAPEFKKPAPDVLEIHITGLYLSLPQGFKPPSDSLANAAVKTVAAGTVITLYLARPMGAQVWTDGNTVRIELLKPTITGGLAGKLIVVDPGHGGHDRGAHAADVNEKDLTLSIGKLLASKLAAAGATVIMTRKTDVFIPLETRAQIANDSHADLFISCHINSTGGSGDQSGGITFHHKGREMGKLLAECIQREIAKVSGLPSLGVWSDGRIYQSGFAVLRLTKMPGVLMELGFINHGSDRDRMVTEDFQDAVSTAMVKGIKVFLGDAKEEE